MTRSQTLSLALCTLMVACVDGTDPVDNTVENAPGGAVGGEQNTFSHTDIMPNIWEALRSRVEEGPPEYASRVHACTKVKYATIGRILASRGVNVANATATSAGALYRNGGQALSAPRLAARVREGSDVTAAGAAKLYDILAQAAPEIIAAMPSRTECAVGGVPTTMFDGAGNCTPRGIMCLTGRPADPRELELCSYTAKNASSSETGKNLAVAVVLAAAHSCE